jgi:intracellular sulfur oxidation DsrE/DsrF family protein
MNAGVKLSCEGSAALSDLKDLANAGVEILNCGTCLDWFNLKDTLAVGRESNMIEILGLMNSAPRVIRL